MFGRPPGWRKAKASLPDRAPRMRPMNERSKPKAVRNAVLGLALATAPTGAAEAVERQIAERGPARIEVLAQGSGPVIVLLPSLGRGAEDFDEIAERIAAAGFRVIRPEPRGIGRSAGPM